MDIYQGTLGNILRGERQRKYNINYISAKLEKIYGDEVVLDKERFIYNQKAWFIHKIYGSWYAYINNVLRGHNHPMAGKKKVKITNLKKYGVQNPLQNYDIQQKNYKSNWKTIIMKHWRTNEDLLVRASFQYAVISFLNNNKIDFNWQIPFYLNINNKKRLYVCDLYLVEKNLYVEIKGTFKSQLNKLKWEIFHNEYKNSEIWFEKDIKQLVGKSKYKFSKEFKLRLNQKQKGI